MQVESLELFPLLACKNIVDDGQHQVHQKVEVDAEVRDEEDGRDPIVVVRGHHHVRIAANVQFRLLCSREVVGKLTQ